MRTMYGEKSEYIEDIFKAETDIDVSRTEKKLSHLHFPDLRMKLRRARDKGGVRVPAPHLTSGKL